MSDKDSNKEHQYKINHSIADPNQEAATPVPAATVLLVREGKTTPEVFMIQRAAKTNFGGAWVFPGGKLDQEDYQESLYDKCGGLNDQKASEILGIESSGLGYWVACIRECFEECGVLLAYTEDKILFNPDSEQQKILDSYRDKLNNGEHVLNELCEEFNLTLATDHLGFLSHWITPKMEKRRYDTRFFVALSPEHQKAEHDGGEGVKSSWITPEEALTKGAEGTFPIIMPTIKNLEAISGFSTTEDLLDDKSKNNHQKSPSILPKFFMEDGKLIGLLPGDEGYEDH